ncbi:hypothetical protein TNCV_334391 [Trichonephila clavipes]|nr:hypothetical protein TNCV_334391 [Trichonephila clavipes]
MFHVLADLEYPCIPGVGFISGSKIVLDFDRKALAILDLLVKDNEVDEGNLSVDVLETELNVVTNVSDKNPFESRKWTTPFQKLVMVLDGTEFVVGDIDKLFDEARRNTKAKHKKVGEIV